jgi:hypothetical protein
MADESNRRFDDLMKLLDFRMKRIVSRRDHEWKVTIGLWALLAAGILELRIYDLCSLAFGLVAIFVMHVFWIRSHWIHSKEDSNISFYYADRAAECARERNGKEILEGRGVGDIGIKLDNYQMSRADKQFGFARTAVCLV